MQTSGGWSKCFSRDACKAPLSGIHPNQPRTSCNYSGEWTNVAAPQVCKSLVIKNVSKRQSLSVSSCELSRCQLLLSWIHVGTNNCITPENPGPRPTLLVWRWPCLPVGFGIWPHSPQLRRAVQTSPEFFLDLSPFATVCNSWNLFCLAGRLNAKARTEVSKELLLLVTSPEVIKEWRVFRHRHRFKWFCFPQHCKGKQHVTIFCCYVMMHDPAGWFVNSWLQLQHASSGSACKTPQLFASAFGRQDKIYIE